MEYEEPVRYLITVYLVFLQSANAFMGNYYKTKKHSWIHRTNTYDTEFFMWFQSYGIKVGYGGIPGPSGGRDGPSAAAGGCCS